MTIKAAVASAIAVVGAWGSATPASAAEISLFASNALNAILEEIVPRFERASGHTVTLRLGVAARLRQDIENGAAFDVAILVGNLDDLINQGKIATGTSIVLGRSGYGLAVRQGAAKPDIATTEAFKQAMLRANSIAYTEGGGSGIQATRRRGGTLGVHRSTHGKRTIGPPRGAPGGPTDNVRQGTGAARRFFGDFFGSLQL